MNNTEQSFLIYVRLKVSGNKKLSENKIRKLIESLVKGELRFANSDNHNFIGRVSDVIEDS